MVMLAVGVTLQCSVGQLGLGGADGVDGAGGMGEYQHGCAGTSG